MNERFHVIPLGDSKAHAEAGEYCKCQPEIVYEHGDTIVIHNAYDGREFIEAEAVIPLNAVITSS